MSGLFTSPVMAVPPMPTDPAEALRIEHSRLRRAVLYSMHEHHVRQRVYEAVGSTRATAWRIVDMTSNPAWYVCSQLAALYRDLPAVDPPAGGEDVAASIAESGLWQLMARVQRDAIGLNDVFLRVDVDKDGPAFRLVPPDLAQVTSNPLAPSQPLAIREWITDPDEPGKWVQLVTDPRTRTYQALDAQGQDISDRVLGGTFVGETYPFLVEGKPVLPYVAYHAAESGYALDPYSGREVFEGSLQLGVYYSFFGHVLRQAAWGQRWVLGAEPAGGDVAEDGRRREVVADPATLLVLRQMEDATGTPSAGQWSAPVDPDRVLAAVERYERRVVEMALGNVGVSRRESDVRSAASLAVSRESQRQAQRAYEPIFRRSDLRLLSLVSGLMGGPTAGWRINYSAIEEDPAEMAARTAELQALLTMGLISKVEAYQRMHPGMTEEEATAALKAIQEINDQFKGAAKPAGTPPPKPAPGAGDPPPAI